MENLMAKIEDNDLLWLIEQNLNAYISWVAAWLVCMLGILQILTVLQTQETSYTSYYLILVYGILNAGSIFPAWRLINILKAHIGLAKQLSEDKVELRNHMICNRGTLSKFFVDGEGNICKINRGFALLYFVVPLVFLYMSPRPVQSDFYYILIIIIDSFFWLLFSLR